MGTVYRRKDSQFLWIKWTDADGREHRRSAETEDPERARKLVNEIERQERARAPRGELNALTVRKFFDETWLPLRQRTREWAWKSDRAAMETHFLPHFGGRVLAEFGTDAGQVELLDWLIGLREHRSKRDGTRIAARTVRNVSSSVRVFFGDALERRVIRRDPTAAWNASKHLPAIEDKERGWRQTAGFTLEQVVALTTDRRVPEDRRALYALRFLGGLRPGEAANARWRDLDRTKRPLWRLTLEGAFNSPMRREKATKTSATLHIPIHPVTQRALEAWAAGGWERFMGRRPAPDDLIFPREDGAHRLVSGSYKQFVADQEAVGFPPQRQYETRSTFRNLALLGGAAEFHLNLITHPSPKRASDLYTRVDLQWPKMCEAVLAIDAAAWAAGVTSRVTSEEPGKTKALKSLDSRAFEMEREKGFEALR